MSEGLPIARFHHIGLRRDDEELAVVAVGEVGWPVVGQEVGIGVRQDTYLVWRA